MYNVIYKCICACICVYQRVCAWICVNMNVYACICVYMRVYSRICVYIRVYMCVYAVYARICVTRVLNCKGGETNPIRTQKVGLSSRAYICVQAQRGWSVHPSCFGTIHQAAGR